MKHSVQFNFKTKSGKVHEHLFEFVDTESLLKFIEVSGFLLTDSDFVKSFYVKNYE